MSGFGEDPACPLDSDLVQASNTYLGNRDMYINIISTYRYDFLPLNGHMAVTPRTLYCLWDATYSTYTCIYVRKWRLSREKAARGYSPMSTADKLLSYNWFREERYMRAYLQYVKSAVDSIAALYIRWKPAHGEAPYCIRKLP